MEAEKARQKRANFWRYQTEAAIVDLVSFKRGHPISKAGMEIHRQQSLINQLIPQSGDLRRASTVAAAAKQQDYKVRGEEPKGLVL